MGPLSVCLARMEKQTGDVAVVGAHQGGQVGLDKAQGCFYNSISCYRCA